MNRASHRLSLAIGLAAFTVMVPQPSWSGDLDQTEKIAKGEEASDSAALEESKNSAALLEIKRLRDDLRATQSKVQDLESRADTNPFTPPAALGLKKDEKIDPVNQAYPIAKRGGLRLAQVHFNTNSTKLSPSGERLAREAAEWLKTLSTKKVIVAGYSDTIGPADVNKKLSKMRATEVAAVLERAGIDPSMIEIVGSGEEGLPQKTGDNVAEPMNRCVGIIAITDEAKS